MTTHEYLKKFVLYLASRGRERISIDKKPVRDRDFLLRGVV